MLRLPLRPLSAGAFAAYGDVLDLASGATRAINAGTSQRVDLAGTPDLHREGGRPVLATFRASAQPLAGPWRMLERHRLGSQTFVPIAAGRWVVLVARGDEQPDLATLAAFLVADGQGITLDAATWHHPLIALDDGVFLVLERAGAAVDCDVMQLPQAVELVVA